MNTYICEYLNQIPKFYEKNQFNRHISSAFNKPY